MQLSRPTIIGSSCLGPVVIVMVVLSCMVVAFVRAVAPGLCPGHKRFVVGFTYGKEFIIMINITLCIQLHVTVTI